MFFDGRQLHPEAVEQFEQVIAIRQRDPRAYDYLALNLEALGKAEKAEAAYQKGLQVNEGPLFDSFLDYNYGRFLMKSNRLAESKEYLDRAVRLAPGTRAVYYEHGRLNLRLQKYKEAQVDAERLDCGELDRRGMSRVQQRGLGELEPQVIGIQSGGGEGLT